MDRLVPSHEHYEGGFTLLEVMISAVILITGLLSGLYLWGGIRHHRDRPGG